MVEKLGYFVRSPNWKALLRIVLAVLIMMRLQTKFKKKKDFDDEIALLGGLDSRKEG